MFVSPLVRAPDAEAESWWGWIQQTKRRWNLGDSERWHTPFLERLGFGGAAGRRGSCACKRASLWHLNRIRGKKRQVADKNEWEAERKAKPHKTKIKLKTRISISNEAPQWERKSWTTTAAKHSGKPDPLSLFELLTVTTQTHITTALWHFCKNSKALWSEMKLQTVEHRWMKSTS